MYNSPLIKRNELTALVYSLAYSTTVGALRIFAVYGLWGRRVVVPILFESAALVKSPIIVVNYGNQKSDIVHIDDGVNRILIIIQMSELQHQVIV